MRVLHLVKTNVGAVWALRQMRVLRELGVEVHVAVPPGGVLTDEYERAKAKQLILTRKYDEELLLWLRRLRDESYVEYRLDES